MKHILSKTHYIIAFLLLFGLNLNAKDSETKRNEKNIVEVLDKVYEDVCSYSEPEFPGIFNYSIGRIIQLRMLYVISLALFISLAYKTILVIGDPNQEFSKYMFLKPVMLLLFLTFYPFAMRTVNAIMEHITFKDIAKKSVAVTKVNTDAMSIWSYNEATTYSMAMDDSPNNTEYTEESASAMDIMKDPELRRQYELNMAINEAKKSGTQLTQDQLDEIAFELDKKTEGRGIVRSFQTFTFWIGDKISIIMRIIQTVILCILFVGGPIAILAEVIFPGSLKKWFGVFIHTHLWTPVIFLIDIVSALINSALEKVDPGTASLIGFVVSIVIIALYIIVSKIASYFIQSQEGGGVLGAMSFKTLQYLRAGAQTVMGGTGGITGAFKGTLGKN